MNSSRHMHGRLGFTLIEILVALLLLSLLAAAVFPVITQQADEGDPVRVTNDLANLRTGIEVFSLNVRPHLPGDIEDLVNEVEVDGGIADDRNAGGEDYPAGAASRWNGPYVDASIPSGATAAAAVVTTGYGADVLNGFVLYDTGAANGGAVTATAADAEFLAVRLAGLSALGFVRVNALIDGDAEDTETEQEQFGRLRCPGTTCDPATSTVYYLAVPVRR